MKHTTGEFIAILLATVILVAISIIIKPSITGYLLYEFTNFSYDSNIIIENSLQLKQHSYTTNWTTEETIYSTLIFAEENSHDKLDRLTSKDNYFLELEKTHSLKIKFENILISGDIVNFYLKGARENIINICNFNEEFCNDTYASFYYPGQEGYYFTTISLPEPTNEFTIDAAYLIKIDYINSSHTEINSYTNISYYYNPAEVETETIEPENLLKWDLFTADYILNNQSLAFYYKTNGDYIEFTPPYNFSAINSSKLKFKLYLYSDNSSTPVINALKINYIEYTESCIENWSCTDWNDCINSTQTRICTDFNDCNSYVNKPSEEQSCTMSQEESASPAASSGKPSVTRYSSMPSTLSAPSATETPASSPVKTQTVTQEIEPLKEISKEVLEPETSPGKINKLKYYVSFFLFILLIVLAYSIYHKHKNKKKTFLYYY